MKKSSFTLIELIIVISIIGLIAALVAPNLFNKGEELKADTCRLKINTLKAAVIDHKISTGQFPDSLEVLVGKAYKKLPLDPWNKEFIYRKDSSLFDKFEIMSYGSDGAPGGEGADADIKLSDI